jgi:hypothetical protein
VSTKAWSDRSSSFTPIITKRPEYRFDVVEVHATKHSGTHNHDLMAACDPTSERTGGAQP